MRSKLTALLFSTLVFSGISHAASLVINGGFETGDLTAWTVGGGNPTDPGVYPNTDPYVPSHSGDWALDLGPDAVGTNGGFASQTITVTAGRHVFDFWHIIEPLGDPSSTFHVEITGVAGYSTNLTSNGRYQHFSTDLVAASAGLLTITFTETSNGGYSTVIDDVNLSAVPEPGSLLLAGIGLAGVLAVRRRRR